MHTPHKCPHTPHKWLHTPHKWLHTPHKWLHTYPMYNYNVVIHMKMYFGYVTVCFSLWISENTLADNTLDVLRKWNTNFLPNW